ncbi:DUF84 family protein [Anaerobacillus alkalilacustris]
MAVKEGKTLGQAIDQYTGRTEVSKTEGAMGIITNGYMKCLLM